MELQTRAMAVIIASVWVSERRWVREREGCALEYFAMRAALCHMINTAIDAGIAFFRYQVYWLVENLKLLEEKGKFANGCAHIP